MRRLALNLALLPARLAVRAVLAVAPGPFRLTQAADQGATGEDLRIRTVPFHLGGREDDMQLAESVVNARRVYVGESLIDPEVPPLLFTFDEVAERHMDHMCPAAIGPIIGHCIQRVEREASSEV